MADSDPDPNSFLGKSGQARADNTHMPKLTAPAAPPPPTAPPPPSVPAAPSGATPPAVPSTVTAPIDFRGLMQKIQTMTQAGKLSTDQVNAALAGVGLKPEEMAQLIGNTLYIASINAAIDACLA